MMNILSVFVRVSTFLIPGFLLSKLLFPKGNSLWVASIGTLSSFILTGLEAIIITELGYLVSTPTFVIFNLVLSFVFSFILFKKDYGSLSKKIFQQIVLSKFKWDASTGAIISVIFFTSLIILIVPIAKINNSQGFTEFLIIEGFSEDAPWKMPHNTHEPISLNYVLISHEKYPKNYEVILRSNSEVIFIDEHKMVKPGESIVRNIIIPPRFENPQQYQLILRMEDNPNPYRSLFFWIYSD